MKKLVANYFVRRLQKNMSKLSANMCHCGPCVFPREKQNVYTAGQVAENWSLENSAITGRQ